MFSTQKGRAVHNPGDRLGRYELLSRLAVGGMAEIFLARAGGLEGFEKLTVVKRILPQHAENTALVALFLEEARLAATLNHPNIAHVYDIGVVRGSFFLAMEYIHGEDLRALQRTLAKQRKGLRLEHALAIVSGICAGLHHAHQKVGPDGRPLGIVHRDVSPSNVLVTYDGGVKIVDFGIAKATLKYKQTKIGALKGKASYMSPEQARGHEVDRRSDVFAIGILLYELSTGFRLFTGKTEYEAMRRIIDEDAPPPSVRLPAYPKGLEEILLTALRRNPAERYQTAQELQAAIEAFAVEHRIPLSTLGLARLMNDLFGPKIEAWHAAEREGRTLTEHVTSTMPGLASQTPVVEPAGGGRARSRGFWLVLAVLVMLGLGAYGAYLILGPPRTPTPVAPEASPGSPDAR